MEAPRVEVYERKDGGFDWRLIGLNGEQLAESSQGYTERGDARDGFITTSHTIGTMRLPHLEDRIVDVDRNGQPIS